MPDARDSYSALEAELKAMPEARLNPGLKDSIWTAARPAASGGALRLWLPIAALALLGAGLWMNRDTFRNRPGRISATAQAPSLPANIPPIRVLSVETGGTVPVATLQDMKDLRAAGFKRGDAVADHVVADIQANAVRLEATGSGSPVILDSASNAETWREYMKDYYIYIESRGRASALTADDLRCLRNAADAGSSEAMALLRTLAAAGHPAQALAQAELLAGQDLTQIDRLLDTARTGALTYRKRALQMLMQIDAPPVAAYFHEALTHPDDPLLPLIIDHLKSRKDTLAAAPLRALLASDAASEDTKTAAREALREIFE